MQTPPTLEKRRHSTHRQRKVEGHQVYARTAKRSDRSRLMSKSSRQVAYQDELGGFLGIGPTTTDPGSLLK